MKANRKVGFFLPIPLSQSSPNRRFNLGPDLEDRTQSTDNGLFSCCLDFRMNRLPQLTPLNVESIVKQIQDAESILLTTHKQCDGDGLGAALGLYHALKKMGKSVRAITVDEVPSKYSFLNFDSFLDIYEQPHRPIESTDLALIFDTNDKRQIAPLYGELEKNCKNILFVDHHPVLNKGPEPTLGSFIDTRAASTGEIAYFIVKALGVRLDKEIARALYTSIAFDTQIFRFIKSSSASYLIGAELLEFERDPEEIHRKLFSTYSREKVDFLSRTLGRIEYYGENRVAVIEIKKSDLDEFGLHADDSRDVIDFVMHIQALQAAVLMREDQPNKYKLSLRSKGKIEVLGIAENLGGGGHLYASGAYVEDSFVNIREQVVTQLLQRLDIAGS
ncbi:MAG: hypothetical protein CL675_03485 [Bdellovibrionaceae bacterium]|nr:hypothetical protein [Pseudobdellovibrionaceae bacterium]